jgi:polysaccharide deacetylase 2 family uncharacterized protein YibQ
VPFSTVRLPAVSAALILIVVLCLPRGRSPEQVTEQPVEQPTPAQQTAQAHQTQPQETSLPPTTLPTTETVTTNAPPPSHEVNPPADVLPPGPPSAPENLPSTPQAETSPPGKTPPRPRIAVIIDDMGYDRPMGRQFLQIDADLTFSFLPEAPYTSELAEQAHRTGRTTLVHLPMEPKDSSWKLGPEALRIGDTAEEISRKTEGMLANVPYAVGANNHMGSRFTENSQGMRRMLATLKAHSFFFIDSFTTPASLGEITARQLRLPTARRHVFLDNTQDPESICRQLGQLVAQAKQRGQAIGIGHPNQAMFTALGSCGPAYLAEVELVGVHQLAH